MHRSILSVLASLPLLALTQTAPAQQAPTCPRKVVKFVVPYPPGGSSDLLARLLVPDLSKQLAVTIVVENKAGAVGNIGTAQAMSADADGCTWLLGNSSNVVISRNLYKLTRDPVEHLTPVAQVAAVPMVLYVSSAVPAATFQEFIALVRKNPGKYSYATPGAGSTHHLLTEMMKIEFGLDAAHVPYKGSGPAIQDVIAGHLAFAFEGTSAIAPHIASGKVRALATSGAQRSVTLPNVPTLKELGHSKFVATNWYGVFVPANTPPGLVTRLNAAIRQSMKSPEVVDNLAKLDSRVPDLSAAEFGEFVKKEVPYWKTLVATTGVTVE
ncbi:MAG: tripartite tricarboxylate transporter substrate binding protein [Proteobacteria bacterium]|nr:tripartite tricarboxylate transporter substrate binding protein [Pseudomonadota bacterium]